MSIFFQSQVTGCHSRYTRGFSLVELLISITIIGIITSVVLVKFTDFDSTTILKGVAYEVAATVREAQVLSISVLGAENNFRRTYGVYFERGSSDYIVFTDSNPPSTNNPPIQPYYKEGRLGVSAINTYTMMRGITVADICVTQNPGGISCSSDLSGDGALISGLNVSFRRPEFTALYSRVNSSRNHIPFVGQIEEVVIKLKSDRGDNKWNVTIGALGHISVVKD